MLYVAPLWLALAGCAPDGPAPPVTLTLVAMNDFHGALYETPIRKVEGRAHGGLPWLVSAVQALRAEDPDLLVFDGGDLFQGSWPVNASKGMGSIEALNMVGLDAAAVGNHEFDYGGIEGGHPLRGALERAAKAADFAWLTANVRTQDGERWQPEGIAPWTVLERKGVKIGVFGLTTVDTPETTLKKNVADLSFTDPAIAAEEAIAALRAEGAQVIVGLGHVTGSCDPPDYGTPPPPGDPGGELGKLLDALEPGSIDVFVAGHMHTLMAHRWRNTIVLEARSRGHALNRVHLVVGPDGVDREASTIDTPWMLEHDAVDPGCTDSPFPTAALDVGGRSLTPSPPALDLIERLEADAGSLCDPAGCMATALSRSRGGESGVGDFVADALLAAFPTADVAVQNSGGLRADLPAGPLIREHLQQVMPFENRLLMVEMTGTQLRRMFRLGSSGGHGILQVAGATYRFDPERTTGDDLDGDGAVAAWERDRLCEVQVAGAPLEPERTYRVITSDFLYGGGDHMGPAYADTEVIEQGPLLRDALVAYLEEQEACVGSASALPDPDKPRIELGPCEP